MSRGPTLYLEAVLVQKASLFRALRRAVKLTAAAEDQTPPQSASGRETLRCLSADEVLRFRCPVLGASCGQHLRHSLDHVRHAVNATLAEAPHAVVAYDERARGTAVEEHLVAAEREVASLRSCLEELNHRTSRGPYFDLSLPLVARFAFAPAPGQAESGHLDLPTHAAREIVFAAHHALHHNASILTLIKLNEGVAPGLLPALMDLAPDFGTAPSTTVFQRAQEMDTEAPPDLLMK